MAQSTLWQDLAPPISVPEALDNQPLHAAWLDLNREGFNGVEIVENVGHEDYEKKCMCYWSLDDAVTVEFAMC